MRAIAIAGAAAGVGILSSMEPPARTAQLRIAFWGSLRGLLATDHVQAFTALIEAELAKRGADVECWLTPARGDLCVDSRFRSGPVPEAEARRLRSAVERSPIAVGHRDDPARYQSQTVQLLGPEDVAAESDDSDAELVMHE